MIELLPAKDADALFRSLPVDMHVGTLSPAYARADAARDRALEPIHLCYREGEHFWLHSVHRGCVLDGRWYDLQSPYGYGGPIANCDDPAFASRAWTHHARWCADNSVLAEFVRFHPLARNWSLYGGSIRDDRKTVAVDLEVPDLLASYATRCRTAVRKARASGCAAAWYEPTEFIAQFRALYEQGMRRIGADEFYLFGDDYFKRLVGLEGVRLLVIEHDGEWDAAALFADSGNVREYHLSVTGPAGRSRGATNLLLHAAAEDAREKGLRWLYLGGGTDSAADNRLLFFKAGFSALQLPFRIGYAIHHPDDYRMLRDKLKPGEAASRRVLFYR